MPIVPNVTVDMSRFEAKLQDLTRKQFEAMAQNGLAVAATIVEDAAKQLAPKHVGDHIQHSQVTRINENEYEVRVFVKIVDAPDAGAWEYGSGLHRTKGSPAKYSIDAINAPNLVFYWEREGRWFKGLHVNHPGIAARPYLRPALKNNVERIKAEFHGHAK
jgi:hypothetical protein